MFDVQIINDEAVLFENDVEVKNLEYLRDYDGIIQYDFDDGNYVRIDSDYDIAWLDSDGKLNRDGDMPAYIRTNGYMSYRKHGKRHRECGPAVIYYDGKVEYWIDGIEYTKEDYDAEMAKHNPVKDAIEILNHINMSDSERAAWDLIKSRL